MCRWSADEEGNPLVVVAGKKGVIHVISSDACTLPDEGTGVDVQVNQLIAAVARNAGSWLC